MPSSDPVSGVGGVVGGVGVPCGPTTTLLPMLSWCVFTRAGVGFARHRAGVGLSDFRGWCLRLRVQTGPRCGFRCFLFFVA